MPYTIAEKKNCLVMDIEKFVENIEYIYYKN